MISESVPSECMTQQTKTDFLEHGNWLIRILFTIGPDSVIVLGTVEKPEKKSLTAHSLFMRKEFFK